MTDSPTSSSGRPQSSALVHSQDSSFAKRRGSVLVLSKDESLATRLSDSLSAEDRMAVKVETTNLSKLNGKALDYSRLHDAVIVDVASQDEDESSALKDLLKSRHGSTSYFALVDDRLSIAEAMKLREAGIDEVLPNTIRPAELNRAIEASLSHRLSVSDDGAIFSVSKARGGVGATTVAVNLACKLVGRKGLLRKTEGRRIALVDLDVQFGDANVLLDIEDNGSLATMIRDRVVPDASDLKTVMQRHPSGVDILCAPSEMVPLDAVSSTMVGNLLDLLRSQYDAVVVDFPSAIVDWLSPILERTTRLYMVMDTTVPGVRQARRVTELYREEHIGLPVEFVVNRAKKPMIKSSQVKEAEKVLEAKLNIWLPNAPSETARAADIGHPLVEQYPKSGLGKAFTGLAHTAEKLVPAGRVQPQRGA